MTTVIMQPTFLPWIGYFDLIDRAEHFVFLDNVQFEKQSWQQRNRIRTASGLEWITVPVFIKGKFGQTIDEVRIKITDFPDKQLKALRQHYSGCPHFETYWPELESLLSMTEENDSLRDMNVAIIRHIAGLLDLKCNFHLSSDYPVDKKRSSRLVFLLQKLNENQYLSPAGSMAYLREDLDLFDSAGIDVWIQQMTAPVYKQRYAPFEPGASVLDMLFNVGAKETLSLLRANSRDPVPLQIVCQENAGW
jgi:hypothetical protein